MIEGSSVTTNITVVEAADRTLAQIVRNAGLTVASTVPIEDLAGIDRQPGRPADVLLLDLRGRTDVPHELTSLKRRNPQTGVIIVASALDPTLMLEAMRAGVTEFVTDPITAADLKAAVERISGQQTTSSVGQVVAFLGAKGGVGTTTMAVNVAAVLADDKDARVLMVDLHSAVHGDAALLFGVEPKFSVADALENVNRLDQAFLSGLVQRAKPGLDVLVSPDRPTARPPEGHRVAALIERLAAHYDRVVLDVPRSDLGLLDALEPVAAMMLVVNQELPTVRRAAQIAGILRQRHGKDRVGTVVTRYDPRAEIRQDDIERVVGLPVWGVMPSDYRLTLTAANLGKPLVIENHSRLANAVRQLAGRLAGTTTAAESGKRPAKKASSRLAGLF
jgi:pilus assembly protein CpaE